MANRIHPLRTDRHRSDSDRRRVALFADRQWGQVPRHQLRACGISSARIGRWVVEGYLHPSYPGVYGVGHTATGTEAQLAGALLYAGPGAMLSHETAAWWWGLTDRQPRAIHVSTPRVCSSLAGGARRPLQVHGRRSLDRIWHQRLPVTTIPQTLLDFASVASLRRVRRALAEAEFRRLLDFDALEPTLGRGRPGSTRLRRALEHHRPELAETRSVLEQRFVELCEIGGLPRPELNVKVCGLMVDALWRDQRVIVELDGRDAHGTPAQVARDHERDLRLRAAGFTVLRYTWRQITRLPDLVLADLRRELGLPRVDLVRADLRRALGLP